MKQKGFVEMHRDSADGRQTIVVLAAKGRAAYDKAAPVMARRRAALKTAFTPAEIEDFVGYLDRLEGFLRQPINMILQENTAK